MYQNFYHGYYHDYTDSMYDFRAPFFMYRIGTFQTILHDLPVGGGVIPSGTRIFIHSVRFDAAQNELVTIVFAQGGIVRKTEVFGTDIIKPAPTQQFRPLG